MPDGRTLEACVIRCEPDRSRCCTPNSGLKSTRRAGVEVILNCPGSFLTVMVGLGCFRRAA